MCFSKGKAKKILPKKRNRKITKKKLPKKKEEEGRKKKVFERVNRK